MKQILLLLSLALAFSLPAVQGEETNPTNTFQIEQVVEQLDTDECAQLFFDETQAQLEDDSSSVQTSCC